MSKKIRPESRMSYRLKHWDYGNNAPYFITLCTQDRKHFFGEITNGEMHLSHIGKIVENEWKRTPQIRPDMHLELDEFVVMPNHFHAILVIGKNQYNGGDTMPSGDARQGWDARHCVSTYQNKFGPQSNNLYVPTNSKNIFYFLLKIETYPVTFQFKS